jgi:molybdenum cofactor cytidylyltransferase
VDVVAIVLSAGRSSRMGRSKAALPIGSGETFLGRILATLLDAGLPRIVVVVGAGNDVTSSLPPRLANLTSVVVNPAPERGQLSSLLCGLDAIDAETRAALVTLIDLPLVAPRTVSALVSAWRTSNAPVVRPVVAGCHGHPVILARELFDELRVADPGQGAKLVIRRHQPDELLVPVADLGCITDIDTPEDYERLIGPLAPAPGGESPG